MKNILIVDDASLMRNIIRTILNQMGHENIYEAATGLQAIDTIKNQKLDLVITGLAMPISSGLDVIKYIRTMKMDLPIIVETSKSDNVYRDQCLEHGAAAYIVKPFATEVFKKAVAKQLG